MKKKLVFVDVTKGDLGSVIAVANVHDFKIAEWLDELENPTCGRCFYLRQTQGVYEMLESSEDNDEEVVIWCVPNLQRSGWGRARLSD